jgi:hypothetical protein
MFYAGEKLALEGEPVEGDNNGGQQGAETVSIDVKASDKKRMLQRPVYREWFANFIPMLRLQNKFCKPIAVTREQVREEAFVQFGVKDGYEKQLKEWLLNKNREELPRLIKGAVPQELEGQERAAIVREMKEIIVNGGTFNGAIPEAAKTDNEGFWDLEKVRTFISEHWKKVMEIGLAKETERSKEIMREKEAARSKDIEK